MMNVLKNDPSGGTLWWAKEADLQLYEESPTDALVRISSLPPGRLSGILVFFVREPHFLSNWER